MALRKARLNPYSNGRYSTSVLLTQLQRISEVAVLILILMEDTLRADWEISVQTWAGRS